MLRIALVQRVADSFEHILAGTPVELGVMLRYAVLDWRFQ